jgi:Zn-finger nucleic acid-binding protein
MRDDLKKEGYSQEEEYFHRKDRELIAKLREKSQAQRAQLESQHQKEAYWMRCPKCGSQLKEERNGETLLDRCTACGGIFLDKGELEILVKAKAPLLQRIFGR